MKGQLYEIKYCVDRIFKRPQNNWLFNILREKMSEPVFYNPYATALDGLKLDDPVKAGVLDPDSNCPNSTGFDLNQFDELLLVQSIKLNLHLKCKKTK